MVLNASARVATSASEWDTGQPSAGIEWVDAAHVRAASPRRGDNARRSKRERRPSMAPQLQR
jgi:hypothetical protein